MHDSTTIAQANFALNLIRETRLEESTVISPISISFALGMVLLGAKGNTAKEIQDAIAKDTKNDEIHKHLLKTYNFMGENRDTIKIANKIYFKENLHLYESYEMNIQNFYNGNFQLTDFSNTQKATNEINEFVADATNNEIQDIIDMVDENALMILVNALYFERKWENPFTLDSSYSLFYSKPGATKGLIMMSNEGLYNYAAKENYEFLEIPYINNSFSMFIILPNEKFGLSEVLKSLKITEILDLMFSTKLIQGNVTIPKFNAKSSFELSQVLKHLNIKDAFNEEMADFSGTTDSKISISRVLHKVIVKVDEKGTKAAAATVVEDILFSYDEYTDSFTFNADHPFLYLIADKAKNIYFAGTFYD